MHDSKTQSAFPVHKDSTEGISRLDYFTAAALTGLLAGLDVNALPKASVHLVVQDVLGIAKATIDAIDNDIN